MKKNNQNLKLDRKKYIFYFLFSIFCVGILLSTFCFLFSGSALAAEVSFDAKTQEIKTGQSFEVGVFLNTESENINAIEGILRFPADILEFKELNDGNSFINFWVERPSCRAENEIIFSGITPGGFNSEKGLILSAIFEARKEGVAKFEIDEARALRNDGTGSTATLTITPFEVVVSKEIPAEIPVLPKVRDIEKPESFVPEIAADTSIFEGKWFLVFATQDKGSGINYYEVKETRQRFLDVFSKWSQAKSPYILQDQELRSYVFVKAVDKASNERIVKINPQNPLGWYENYENWIIIILGLFVSAVIGKILWKKCKK